MGTRSQAGLECGPGPSPPVWVVILSRPRQHTFVIICQTTANMKEYQSGEVKGLLETLSVPHNPPNRSQWRKLELAVKFIHKSKQSAIETHQMTQVSLIKRRKAKQDSDEEPERK